MHENLLTKICQQTFCQRIFVAVISVDKFSMKRITWLIEQFQFTYRQLAQLLHVSPDLVHRFHNDKRKLPARNQGLLDHPLFAPYPIRKEMSLLPDPEWEDPDKEIRNLETETRWNLLFLERRKVSNQLDAMKDRRLTLLRILYHTRNLPYSRKGGELSRW